MGKDSRIPAGTQSPRCSSRSNRTAVICTNTFLPLTLYLGFETYQAHSSPSKKLAQPLGTSPEELAQGTDPCQAQRHPEQTIEDTEEAPSWGLGSHVAIT